MNPRTITLLALALTGCMQSYGAARCDDESNQCGRPAPAGLTLGDIRGAQRPAVGATVRANSVVLTAFDEYDEDGSGNIGDVYLQALVPRGSSTDPWSPCPITQDGMYRVCGISTFSTSFQPSGFHPVPGNVVDIVSGTYDEFNCSGVCGNPPQPFPDGRYLPQIRNVTLRSAGVAPLPQPLVVTLDDMLAHNAELMGVLVEIQNVTTVGAPDRRGEIALTPGSSGVHITQQFTPIVGVVSGTHWDRVVGVVSYFYGPKLIPRTPEDLVGQR